MKLKQTALNFEEKLKKIKLFLTDVDGVLTTGHLLYMGEEVGWNRSFHVQDGYGLKLLKKAGVFVGVISGGESLGLKQRMQGLGIDYCYLGNEDKRDAYLKVKEECQVEDEEILYIGDEFFDLPLLKRVGFSVTVPHASLEIRELCDYTTERAGGHGAVREVVDLIRFAQGIVPEVHDFT